MMPDKPSPDEEYVAFGIRWTPGARKLVFWAVIAACGGGVGVLVNQIPNWLTVAPVWAFIGLFALSCIVNPPVAQASDLPTIPLAALQSVERTYVSTRAEISQ